MQIVTDAVILDGAVGAFGLFKQAPKFIERIAGFLGHLGGADGGALFLVGGLFAFHAHAPDAGGFGCGHVVAILPAYLFLNKLPLLAVADVIDLFRAIPGSPRNLNKIHARIACDRLSFSARHTAFDLFWLDLPHTYGQYVG